MTSSPHMPFKSCLPEHVNSSHPECSICCQPYDQIERVAKILRCGHTICEPCVYLLDAHSNCHGDGFKDLAYLIFRCPICRQPEEMQRDLVTTNFELMNVVVKMREEDWASILYSNCKLCGEIYHEKDLTICLLCTNVPESQFQIGGLAECSTCWRQHAPGSISETLQSVRIKKQRVENQKAFVTLQERLLQAQNRLNSMLGQMKESFSAWAAANEAQILRFHLSTNSLDQRNVYDDVTSRMSRAADRIEKLCVYTDDWCRNMLAESTAPMPVQVSSVQVAPRVDQPESKHNYSYYFEL